MGKQIYYDVRSTQNDTDVSRRAKKHVMFHSFTQSSNINWFINLYVFDKKVIGQLYKY